MRRSPPLVLFALLMFVVTADQFCILVLLPAIGRDLGAGTIATCGLVSAHAAASALFGLFVSPLLDRRRQATIFLSGLLLFTGATAATLIAGHYVVLLALRAITGAGATAVGLGLIAITQQAVPPNARTAANRASMIGAVAGFVLAPLAVGAFGPVDWHWTFGFLCALTLPTVPFAVMLANASLVGRAPADAPRAADPATVARQYAHLVGNPRATLGAGAMAAYAGGVSGLIAILGLWLARGVTPFHAGTVSKAFAAVGLGMLAGDRFGPRLERLIGARHLATSGAITLAACAAALATTVPTLASVFVTCFFLGAVEALRRGPVLRAITRLMPPPYQVPYAVLVNGAGQAGIAVFAPCLGYALDFDRTTRLTWPGVTAAGLAIVAATVIAVLARRTAHEPPTA